MGTFCLFQEGSGVVEALVEIEIADAKGVFAGEDLLVLWLKPKLAGNWYQVFLDWQDIYVLYRDGESPYDYRDDSPLGKSNAIVDFSRLFAGRRIRSAVAGNPHIDGIHLDLRLGLDNGRMILLSMDYDYRTTMKTWGTPSGESNY